MADLITTQFDFTRFDRALSRYVHDLNIDGRKVVKTQARLFLKLLLRFVPPKSLAQGRRAVVRDLHKLFDVVDPGEWELWFDENDRLRMAPMQRGGKRGAAVTDFKEFMSIDRMREFHRSRLDSRGRVKGANYDNLIGRKKSDIAHRGIVKKADFRRYQREVQSHVGRAKAGLQPAASVLGMAMPSWITRHDSSAYGAVDPHLEDRTHPRIRIIDTAPGIAAVEPRSIAQAIATRTRAMESDIRRMMAGGKSRHFS
ncbi:MAG TPA: hypothetical protein VF614_04815 [Chthoniobacteraceae bacterium]|jgi:hypothetical protein